MMRNALTLTLLASLLLAPLATAADDAGQAPAVAAPLLGFDSTAAARERALEARFDALLDASNLRRWMQHLSAHPHHVGSTWDEGNAHYLADLFRSWGYDTHIETFDVLFPTPEVRRVELLEPERFTASLAEPPVPGDPVSAETADRLPVYNAYSADGDVTGELVYVHYGVPADYDELARRGIDVRGKIVLARYGGSWRGIKPKVAAEHGAIGCILYSDPREDGYFQGDPYPEGGYRPEEGAQRGSVEDMPLYPGDPLTPFVGATEDAVRLPLSKAETLTKIPVLPLSWGDALPLLEALGGPVAPESWRGALPTTYHLGPGPAKVHLVAKFDWSRHPIRDVIATLPGSDLPEEWVMRGNHSDAWVEGATDPVSGLVAMLEEARAVAALARAGSPPRRTVVYAAWDGEEPGLLGSVEWAETHADLLRRKLAVYINSDSNSRGFLGMGGSHSLEPFMNQVARDVPDPEAGVSVAARLRARRILEGTPEERKEARERQDLRLRALGSGSDYTAFLQHLGIASLNLGYGGEGHYGQYHSAYDSFEHFNRFMDPGYAYGLTLAKTAGRAVLRLANAQVLPLDFASFETTVAEYEKEVEKLADDLRAEAVERDRNLAAKLYQEVADPTETLLPPPALDPVPHLNFAPLENALETLHRSVEAWKEASGGQAELPPETRQRLDGVLMEAERALTRKQGLPRRPWFVHQIYAPGFYTGYGVKTLPGAREALEQRKWDEAQEQIAIEAATLEDYAALVDRATAILTVQGSAAPPSPAARR